MCPGMYLGMTNQFSYILWKYPVIYPGMTLEYTLWMCPGIYPGMTNQLEHILWMYLGISTRI